MCDVEKFELAERLAYLEAAARSEASAAPSPVAARAFLERSAAPAAA